MICCHEHGKPTVTLHGGARDYFLSTPVDMEGFVAHNTSLVTMPGQRQVRPGQFVNVGTQIIAVVPLPDVWVLANYKETQMTNVRLGDPVSVTVNTALTVPVLPSVTVALPIARAGGGSSVVWSNRAALLPRESSWASRLIPPGSAVLKPAT